VSARAPAGSTAWPPARRGSWVIDLDGVVWLAGEAIEGVAAAIGRLRQAGITPLFVTNNSAPTIGELLERLARAGVACGPDDLVTSAQAASTLVAPGSRVLALAEEGALEALAAGGATLVDESPADVVVVGWTRRFDFDRLTAAATAVRAGARLVGTNDDATYPTPHGLVPGAGSLLAAVATASGARPEVAGKPNRPMVDLICSRRHDVAAVVGDRPSTDGALARTLGVRFALVLSGVTPGGGPPPVPAPDTTAADLAALVADFLGEQSRT